MSQNVQICWITGNFIQRKNIIDIVKKSIYTKNPQYELIEIEEDSTIEYVANKINTYSCFDSPRLIIINEWPEAKSGQTASVNGMVKLLSNLPEDCVIILNNLETRSSKFLELIKSSGKEYHYDEFIDINKASSWIKDEFKKISKSIEDEDIFILIKSISVEKNYQQVVDFDKLYLVFKKLNHYIGQRKKINIEDILAISIDYPDFIIWNLYKHLDNKDIDNSILLSKQLLDNEKNLEGMILMTISGMIWRYSLLFNLKDAVAQKIEEKDIINTLKSFPKLSSEKSGFKTIMKPDLNADGSNKAMFSEGAIKGALKGFGYSKPSIMCYSRKELYYIIDVLNNMLLKMRSGISENEARNYFELVICVICNIIEPEEVNKILKVYRYNYIKGL